MLILKGFFDFYLDHLCATNDVAQDKGRLAIVRAMGEAVLKTRNAVLTDTYAQKTAQRLGVSPEAARAEFKNLRRSQSVQAPDEPSATPEPAARPSTLEFWLLKLLLLDEELLPWAAAHLDLSWVQHAAVRRIISLRLGTLADGQHPSVAAILAEITDAADRGLVTEAVAEQRVVPNRPQQLADISKKLRDQVLDRQLAGLKLRMNQPDLADAERGELLRQQQTLRDLKGKPLALLNPGTAS